MEENIDNQKVKVSQINDFFIRWLFSEKGHEDLLLDFINSFMIDAGMHTFKSVVVNNPFNLKDNSLDTQTIVDVSATTESGETVIIEIQVEGNVKFANRALFYWAENYTNIDKATIDYDTLCPVISINLVNFDIRKNDPRPRTTYMIMDTETHEPLTDMFIMHFLELKKYQNAFETNGLAAWSKYFKSDNLEREANMLIKEKPILERAIEYYKNFNGNRELVNEYKKHITFQVGQAAMLHQERLEGREEGEHNRNIEIARSMLQDNLSIELIAKHTGLTAVEIEEIISEM